ncbi:hypothetical protein QVD17_17093 [Tagetes erecta]|uniref:Uncharacterized protein n=1 Tax=Tagetes erecta TaxID=13708 RepID=A0AAD8KSJ1_TARER|nr:hypothetical protein QVD17_17093 [Tagetes erecta]
MQRRRHLLLQNFSPAVTSFSSLVVYLRRHAVSLRMTESMYGEELLSMTCNVLVQLFWRTKYVGYLLEAIMVLDLGLKIRSYVWQYKILLLHLCFYWNAPSLAYEWYKSLDVKNILLETVSHHIFPQMLTSTLLVDISDVMKGYLKFMDDHFKESADLTFLAYRHRNYSKVIEIVQFKERLQQSNQYLTAKVESSILQLKRKANSIEEAESVLESLYYGSDFVESKTTSWDCMKKFPIILEKAD